MSNLTVNDTPERGFDAVFEGPCPNCAVEAECLKDEITRNCPDRDPFPVFW
jgi:hypothetical protein